MRKIFIVLFVSLSFIGLAQPNVEMQLFVRNFTATTTQLGVKVRSKVGNIPFIGTTFYILYQSANASPASFDDNKIVSTYGWGSSNRFTNPNQTVDITTGGRTYNRRYVYGNADESAGTFIINLSSAWDTLLYITFNNLQATPPQGGYAYAQETSEAAGVALTDLAFVNIPIDVVSGAVALAAAPLPIRLTKFDAKCLANKSALISWSTAEEINNSHFEIEKSTNGLDWKSVGRINGSGNSSSPRNYEFNDLQGGSAQYRLKQVDIDGKVTYSAIAKTSCENRNVYVTLYPVPARDFVNLVIGADKAVKTNVQVFDNKGKLVINMPVAITSGQNNFRINVHSLAVGEYYIRSTDAAIEINRKFTVVR